MGPNEHTIQVTKLQVTKVLSVQRKGTANVLPEDIDVRVFVGGGQTAVLLRPKDFYRTIAHGNHRNVP